MKQGIRAAVVLFVLVSVPFAYVHFCSPNEDAFAQIRQGDSEGTVLALMGKPNHVERRAPYFTGADLEYEYYVFPIPTVWSVSFKKGAVISAAVLQSP